MPKSRAVRLYLDDILCAIRTIRDYSRGMDFDSFAADPKTIDAVLRNLEIIGEAAKNVPSGVKERYPDADWKAASGMRDKLTHGYFGVSIRMVWETVTEDLPAFEAQIERIVKAEEENGRK